MRSETKYISMKYLVDLLHLKTLSICICIIYYYYINVTVVSLYHVSTNRRCIRSIFKRTRWEEKGDRERERLELEWENTSTYTLHTEASIAHHDTTRKWLVEVSSGPQFGTILILNWQSMTHKSRDCCSYYKKLWSSIRGTVAPNLGHYGSQFKTLGI